MFSAEETGLLLVLFVVGILNSSIGSTGGFVFAAMASVLPTAAVVPVHGVVQSSGSLFRAATFYRQIDVKYATAFCTIGLFGFLIGWPLIGLLSESALRMLLGSFILATTWARFGNTSASPGIAGIVTSCLTLLVGATGPMVTAFIARREPVHARVIATQSICNGVQQATKSVLFIASGFAYAEYWELIAALIVINCTGSYIGKRLLLRLPEALLRKVLKLIISLLGLRLILSSFDSVLLRSESFWFGAGLSLLCVLVVPALLTSTVSIMTRVQSTFRGDRHPRLARWRYAALIGFAVVAVWAWQATTSVDSKNERTTAIDAVTETHTLMDQTLPAQSPRPALAQSGRQNAEPVKTNSAEGAASFRPFALGKAPSDTPLQPTAGVVADARNSSTRKNATALNGGPTSSSSTKAAALQQLATHLPESVQELYGNGRIVDSIRSLTKLIAKADGTTRRTLREQKKLLEQAYWSHTTARSARTQQRIDAANRAMQRLAGIEQQLGLPTGSRLTAMQSRKVTKN